VDSRGTDAPNGRKFPGEVLASRGDEPDLRENALKGSKIAGGDCSSGRAEQRGRPKENREATSLEGSKCKPGREEPILSLLRLPKKP